MTAPSPTDVVEVLWTTIRRPPAELEDLRAVLDDAERERIARFARPDDRLRAIVAHGLLRHAVGARLDVDPAIVRVVRRCASCGSSDHGRPVLVVPQRIPPHVSLTHAASLVAVALRAAGPVGVDLEPRDREDDWSAVGRHVFAPGEWDATAATADPAAARVALWTRKEAVVKAMGTGVSVGVERVSLAGGPEPWHVATPPDGAGPVLVTDVALDDRHVGAVAVPWTEHPPTVAVLPAPH